MSKKILFIKRGSFSEVNTNIIKIFEKEFPDFLLDELDIIKDIIEKETFLRRVNWLFMFLEYGLSIILKKKKIYNCYHSTSFLFKKIKKHINIHVNKNNYAFTFQTQSVFDGSTNGIPHFIYTDSTVLANLYFSVANIDKYIYHSKSWLKLEKTIYNNASMIFVSYNEQVKSLTEQYYCNSGKVKCVYFGANSSPLQKDFSEKRYYNKHILFSGIDWERKGGALLIEIFKRVLDKLPDAKLTILGSEPKINLPNCNVVGRVPIDEVGKYYSEASVFCLPTQLDYNGVVCIEAMMYKLPVVTSDIGAFKDYVIQGKNGYLCNPTDIESFASALIDLLDNPQKCKEFGELGCDIAKNKYTWSNTGKLMKKYIERFI